MNEISRDTKKITDDFLPNLINDYCELSLYFRNTVVIKESQNNSGKIIKLTSKDLLLKNCAKIIEHINLIEERFYKELSFSFLVNSRIISELGYKDNFLENKKVAINLENRYKFNIQDDKESIINNIGNTNIRWLNQLHEDSEKNIQKTVKLQPTKTDKKNIEYENFDFLQKEFSLEQIKIKKLEDCSTKIDESELEFFLVLFLSLFGFVFLMFTT